MRGGCGAGDVQPAVDRHDRRTVRLLAGGGRRGRCTSAQETASCTRSRQGGCGASILQPALDWHHRLRCRHFVARRRRRCRLHRLNQWQSGRFQRRGLRQLNVQPAVQRQRQRRDRLFACGGRRRAVLRLRSGLSGRVHPPLDLEGSAVEGDLKQCGEQRVLAGLAISVVAAVGAGLGFTLSGSSSTRTYTVIAAATATGPWRMRSPRRARPLMCARSNGRAHTSAARSPRSRGPRPARVVHQPGAAPLPPPVAASVSGLPHSETSRRVARPTKRSRTRTRASLLETYRRLLDLQYGCHP